MNQNPTSPDTTKEAAQKQTEILRRLGLQGRAALTFQLSDNLRTITIDGIKHRHPEYTPQQINLALFRLTLDPHLFQQAFPNCEIKP